MKNSYAIVFPGQSSQRVGMLSNLATRYSLVEETFAEASESLGYNIWKLVQNGPIAELNKTYRAQPAILTASVAIWRIWKNKGGITPKIMAGHSLGEYSALVCSDAIDLSSAVKLVAIRGELMQEVASYELGAMSVIIGLSESIVSTLCKMVRTDQFIVAPACFNAPENIVISGHKEAVYRVNYLCKKEGAKYVCILPISVPAHCILMKPMVKKFSEILEKVVIRIPNISVINNTSIRIGYDPKDIRYSLVHQLYTPVRWSSIIKYLLENQKIINFLEMGPGKTLSSLIYANINNRVHSIPINDAESLLKAMRMANY